MPIRPRALVRSRLTRAAAFALAMAALPFLTACQGTSAAPARRGGGGGGVPVVVAPVTQRDVPVDIQAIGNVEAYETIVIQSQVTGLLTEALFHEGDFVKKGDRLFTIDPRPFQAALRQAEANLTRDKALLAQAEAQLNRDASQAEYSQLTAERQASLNQRGIVSKDVAEQARAGADALRSAVQADKAAVESARAQLAAQEAAVETSRVQLGYTVINSPIDGRTGNLNVKTGNLVTANSTQLITIQQIEPIYVTFAVPSTYLPTIKQHMSGTKLPVTATPQDAQASPTSGALAFVDNVVDISTDTIRLKAAFDNADRRLWPGQFARVSLRLTTLPGAVVVPSQAVQTGQDGNYVFVVKPDQTVELRNVTAGIRADQDIVIEKGLVKGETIVTEGQLRLEPGTRVDTSAGPGGSGGRGGRGGQGGAGRGRGGRGGGQGQGGGQGSGERGQGGGQAGPAQ